MVEWRIKGFLFFFLKRMQGRQSRNRNGWMKLVSSLLLEKDTQSEEVRNTSFFFSPELNVKQGYNPRNLFFKLYILWFAHHLIQSVKSSSERCEEALITFYNKTVESQQHFNTEFGELDLDSFCPPSTLTYFSEISVDLKMPRWTFKTIDLRFRLHFY